MARSFQIPYAIRYLVAELEDMFDTRLGVPMNAKLPDEGKDGVQKCSLYFPGGRTYKFEVTLTRDPSYGLQINLERLEVGIIFGYEDDAERWIQEVMKISGSVMWCFLDTSYCGGKLRAVWVGNALLRLKRAASSRRNGITVYDHDKDPQQPIV